MRKRELKLYMWMLLYMDYITIMGISKLKMGRYAIVMEKIVGCMMFIFPIILMVVLLRSRYRGKTKIEIISKGTEIPEKVFRCQAKIDDKGKIICRIRFDCRKNGGISIINNQEFNLPICIYFVGMGIMVVDLFYDIPTIILLVICIGWLIISPIALVLNYFSEKKEKKEKLKRLENELTPEYKDVFIKYIDWFPKNMFQEQLKSAGRENIFEVHLHFDSHKGFLEYFDIDQ